MLMPIAPILRLLPHFNSAALLCKKEAYPNPVYASNAIYFARIQGPPPLKKLIQSINHYFS